MAYTDAFEEFLIEQSNEEPDTDDFDPYEDEFPVD